MRIIKILVLLLCVFNTGDIQARHTPIIHIEIVLENLPDNEAFYFTTYKPGSTGDTVCQAQSKEGKVLMKCRLLFNGGDFFFIRNKSNRAILFLDETTSNTLRIRGDYFEWKSIKTEGSKSNFEYSLIDQRLKWFKNRLTEAVKPVNEENNLDSITRHTYNQKVDSLKKNYHKEWRDQISKYPNLAFSACLIASGGFLSLHEKKFAFARLTQRVKSSKYGKELAFKISELEKQGDSLTSTEKSKLVGLGKIVPNFSLKELDGKNYSFQNALKGKKLLYIDFWASWCKPCRTENPNVKKVYDVYKDKGFDILGVSLDYDKLAWKKAIEKDQLNWSHVSDLKGWQSEAAIMFNLTSIPKSILVDNHGKIIAMDLRGEELGKKLEELLGNQPK